MRPHWRNVVAAPVNRFTGGGQIRHFVMTITPRTAMRRQAATICDWKIDRARYVATPIMSDGSEGPPLELRGLFEQFVLETR